MTGTESPVTAVDDRIGALVPDVPPPGVRRRNAVLVTGPWLAGCTSVARALREHLPDTEVIETEDLGPGEVPAVVVFVVSASAPATESDRAVLEAAAAHTDAVVGVVSKIDLHRDWRSVLETNRTAFADHGARYARLPWVGVAAAPDLGEPRCADLVQALRALLDDDALAGRNRLRAWEFRLDSVIRRYDSDAQGSGREARIAALQAERAEADRTARAAKAEQTIALRSQIQQARVQLSYFARNRCASVRTELQEDAAEVTRRGLPQFQRYVESRVGTVIDEVEDGITEHLTGVSEDLGLPLDRSAPARPEAPVIGTPTLRSRRLETRLTIALGAGFGLGVALALNRLIADLAPGLAALGGLVCALIGVLAAVWMVNTRGALHDRAVLDRWIGDLSARLRSSVDQNVATRVLAAEMAMTSELTHRVGTEQHRLARRIGAIDTELREHSAARARAAAERDRALPAVQAALAAVRADLGEPAGTASPRP